MKDSSSLLPRFTSGTTLSQIILLPVAAKALAIENISATSDKAASVIAFLQGEAPLSLTADAAISATTLSVSTSAAATLTVNDEFYLFNTATRTGEIRTLSAKSGGTLTFSGSALAVAYPAVSTRIFKLSAAGSIKVGAATKDLILSPGILTMAPVGRPLVVRLDGTSACAINHLLSRAVD